MSKYDEVKYDADFFRSIDRDVEKIRRSLEWRKTLYRDVFETEHLRSLINKQIQYYFIILTHLLCMEDENEHL